VLKAITEFSKNLALPSVYSLQYTSDEIASLLKKIYDKIQTSHNTDDFSKRILELKDKILNKKTLLACGIVSKDENVEKGKNIIESIYESLSNIIHPGRYETIYNNPVVIFDGAHNENALENFIQITETIKEEDI
jgi:folylpolyglutamate synthase/dihydropteroate synthase